MVEQLVELGHLQHRVLVVGELTVADADRDLVGHRRGPLGEVQVLHDPERRVAELGRHRELLRVRGGVTTGEHHGATGHHERTHDLAGVRVPQPVADLGVERVHLVVAPRGHAVVEAVQVLVAVVDRTERAERHALAIVGVARLALVVVEREVDTALALPRADQRLQWTELVELIERHGGTSR